VTVAASCQADDDSHTCASSWSRVNTWRGEDSGINAAFRHNAIERSENAGIAELNLVIIQRGGRLFTVGAGQFKTRSGRIKFRPGLIIVTGTDDVFLVKNSQALEIGFCEVHLSLCGCNFMIGGLHGGLAALSGSNELRTIHADEYLAALDRVAFANADGFHICHDLGRE